MFLFAESEPMSLDNSLDAKDEKDQLQDPHISKSLFIVV